MARARQTPRPQLQFEWDVTSTGMVVQRSPEQQRLDSLVKQHERLLRDVTKKRAQLEKAEEQARDLTNRFFAGVGPLQDRMRAVCLEIRDLFEGLVGPDSRLGARSKARVRRIYASVMEDVPAPFRPQTVDDDPGTNDTFMGDPFDDESESGPTPRGSRGSDGARFDDTPPSAAGFSAPKHGGEHTAVLRALFRRLAIALHPDKVQDAAEKTARTELMKDVTRAYEAGDVARLVELERLHLASQPIGDDPGAIERRAKELAKSIAELRRQLRRLTAEAKAVRRSLPFGFGGAGSRADPELEMNAMLTDLEEEVEAFEGTRDFVRRFAEGKMSVKEFLAGPAPSTDDVEIDAVLNDVLAELIAEIRPARPAKRTRRKPSRRQKQKPQTSKG